MSIGGIIVHTGDGPFLEISFVMIMLLALFVVYVTYLSIQREAHSPSPRDGGHSQSSADE